VARSGGMKKAQNILVENHERNRPLGRPRRRWKGNIRMKLRKVMW
jgi:hypothetical protein